MSQRVHGVPSRVSAALDQITLASGGAASSQPGVENERLDTAIPIDGGLHMVIYHLPNNIRNAW